MGRRARRRAALRELQRLVRGDSYAEHETKNPSRRRSRFRGVPPIVVGAQLICAALWLALFAPTASAHTNEITISCTTVTFAYTNFPETAVVSHETINIDGTESQRDFSFQGPSATDTVMIDVGAGSHSVSANSEWSFDGKPQGAAEAHKLLSDCGPTTTTIEHATTTFGATTTTTARATTSTTVGEGTSTTISQQGTTSTTKPTTTTTLHGQGSTSSTTLHRQGSTTSTTLHQSTSSSTISPSPPLPFTGSDDGPSLRIALGMIGVGLLAAGLARRRSLYNN